MAQKVEKNIALSRPFKTLELPMKKCNLWIEIWDGTTYNLDFAKFSYLRTAMLVERKSMRLEWKRNY